MFWIRVFSGSGSDFFPEFGSDLEKSGTGSVKNKRSKTAVQEENFFMSFITLNTVLFGQAPPKPNQKHHIFENGRIRTFKTLIRIGEKKPLEKTSPVEMGGHEDTGTALLSRALPPQTVDLAVVVHLVVLEDSQLHLAVLVLDLLGGGVVLLLTLLTTTTVHYIKIFKYLSDKSVILSLLTIKSKRVSHYY